MWFEQLPDTSLTLITLTQVWDVSLGPSKLAKPEGDWLSISPVQHARLHHSNHLILSILEQNGH